MTKIEGVPDGYELMRIGKPKKGEFYIRPDGYVTDASFSFTQEVYAVLRKIEPPKPIEPPEGYRLIEQGVVVGGDLCFTAGWRESERVGDCIEYLLKNGFARAYARKIEPQYRPMTRTEFLAAWKQRNFCPLIDGCGDVVVVNRVTDDTVYLLKGARHSFETLSAYYKFASDDSPLTIEA